MQKNGFSYDKQPVTLKILGKLRIKFKRVLLYSPFWF